MSRIALSVVLFAFAMPLFAASNGTVTIKSPHNVQVTADNLERVLAEKGMTVFARINHAKGAASVDMKLAPTEQIIFGNPKIGTPLMHCERTVAIDLPQKTLIWEDDSGQVWITYNDPEYIKARHEVQGCDEVFERVKSALQSFAEAAASE
jgi:uncharacterized protein (DUF302 family)